MVGAQQAGPFLDLFAAGKLRRRFIRSVPQLIAYNNPIQLAAGLDDVRRSLDAVEQSEACWAANYVV